MEIPLKSASEQAGITEEIIRDVVHTFYEEVRRDPALSPIFARAIGDNWDVHLGRMCDFWSSVLLITGRFKGAPMQKHSVIPDIRPTHFARWLQLFRQTVERVCSTDAARLFVQKAEMIGESLQLGIASRRT